MARWIMGGGDVPRGTSLFQQPEQGKTSQDDLGNQPGNHCSGVAAGVRVGYGGGSGGGGDRNDGGGEHWHVSWHHFRHGGATFLRRGRSFFFPSPEQESPRGCRGPSTWNFDARVALQHCPILQSRKKNASPWRGWQEFFALANWIFLSLADRKPQNEAKESPQFPFR